VGYEEPNHPGTTIEVRVVGVIVRVNLPRHSRMELYTMTVPFAQ
jgi:hypothetical protein